MGSVSGSTDYPIKKLQDITHALDQAAIVAITDRTGKITRDSPP